MEQVVDKILERQGNGNRTIGTALCPLSDKLLRA